MMINRVKPKDWLSDKRIFVAVLSVLIFLLQNPFLIIAPAADVDSSWLIGLKWADLKGLIHGSDIAITYGPLYFLQWAPVNISNDLSLLFEEIIFCLSHFLIIVILVYQLADSLYKRAWQAYSILDKILIVSVLALLAFLPLSFAMLILTINCILFVRLIFDIELSKANRKKCLLNILLNTVLLSLVCLIKFTYAFTALALIGIAIIGLIYKKKALLIAYVLPGFLFLHTILWMLCGQTLSTLPDYYQYGLQHSSGFTEAMMFSITYIEIIFAPICFFVILFTGISSLLLFFKKKDFYHAFILFITLPILVMAFKSSFVRADKGHFNTFFLELIPVIIFLLLFFINDSNFPYKNKVRIFITCALFFSAIIIRNNDYSYVTKNQYLMTLSSNAQKIEIYKESIRAAFPALPSDFSSQAKNKSVDIIPYDIALLYAYDLNWSPTPTIQFYHSYTPTLDSINAMHFKGNKAPDNVICSYRSIDNHYFLWDIPAVFRALLENYTVESLDDNYLILQHRPEERNYYIPVSKGVCPIGTVIDVPVCPGKPVFCNIDISLNLLGKFINILYKPSPLYIRFFIKGKTEPIEHTFIRRLGSDGLFVSKYVADLSDIKAIFEKNYEQDIEKIQIIINTDCFYKPEMKYEFQTILE
jgi:hypothetical protein